MINYKEDQAHYVAVTGILIKDNQYLITKRSAFEKAFPNRWTVPGGKVKTSDYKLRLKDTVDSWYNILENALRREIKEETGLEIKNIGYVVSLVYIRDDNIPCLVISFFAEPANDVTIVLDKSLSEYVWVTLEEAKKYDLISGIYDELSQVDKIFKKK